MSIKLMSWAWETDFPQSEKMVLLCLCDFANDHGSCWPAIETIARKCSVSDRTVQRSIKRLTEWGILTVDMSKGKANEYTIHPRHSVTPDTVSPVTNTTKPPTQCHPTPDTVSPKPSLNHQEPPEVKSADTDRLTFSEFMVQWNLLADVKQLPKAEKATEPRLRAFRNRRKEYPDKADWKRALQTIHDTPWLCGQNEREWCADIDFVLQAKSFTKLVEGSYGR